MDREIIDAIENFYKMKSLYEKKKTIEYEKMKGQMISNEYTKKKMRNYRPDNRISVARCNLITQKNQCNNFNSVDRWKQYE